MEITNQLLFFSGGLGVFNGALMSIYFLFFVKPKRLQNQLFGLLILMLSIRIGKSIFYHFMQGLSKDILQIGLTACLFIGALLLFYVQTSLEQRTALKRQERWQLWGLGILAVSVGLVFPYRNHSDLWNTFFVQSIYLIWSIYIILTGIKLKDTIYKFFVSPKQSTVLEKWLLVVFFTNLLICLIFNSVLHVGFPNYIFGSITFSLIFYVLALFLLFHPQRKIILQGTKQAYQNKKIANQQATEIENGLHELMQQQAWYRKSDLKLPQVADALQISPHLLSQYLNDNLGKTFTNFVNEYRVQAACELLTSEHQFTLEGIGYEVGFRSKSNFFATFKKQKGCTPNQFAQQQKILQKE